MRQLQNTSTFLGKLFPVRPRSSRRKHSLSRPLLQILEDRLTPASTTFSQVDSPLLQSLTTTTGTNPDGGVVSDPQGDLFGTTYSGGASNDGTVFELVKGASGSYTLSTLFAFSGLNGAHPYAGVTLDSKGDIFGTTKAGGADNDGTVYKLSKSTTSSYALTTLLTFTGPNGSFPDGGVALDSVGDLFGTTYSGGADNDGTVFELVNATTSSGTPGYTPIILLAFNGVNGANPTAGVTLDPQGDLFGTTTNGGANKGGVIYELGKALTPGQYGSSTLVSFNGANGANPNGGVTLDPQGDLFGTTTNGGANGDGVIYEFVKASAAVTEPVVLFSFGGPYGQNPQSGVTLDPLGDLFGTTPSGSGSTATGEGTAFELTKSLTGNYTPRTLITFTGANGADPVAGFTLDSQGNLFGTTYAGGANGVGAVYEVARTYFGQTVTLSAEVISSNVANPPTGIVTFFDGSTALGKAPLTNGFATFTTAKLAPGTHAISTSYSGDVTYASGTTQGGIVLVAPVSPVVALFSTGPTAVFEEVVTFTALVGPTAVDTDTPTGSVTFYDAFNGGAPEPLETVTLTAAGAAALATTGLAVGSHDISVIYSGDANYLNSSDTTDSLVTIMPSVQSVVINQGQTQRSMVTNIEVDFNGVVPASELTNAFTLTRTALPNGAPGDNAAIGTITVATSTDDNGNTIAALSFSGSNTEGGSLADGAWALALNNTSIATVNRLYGDYDGAGVVDSTDLGVMGTTFGLASTDPGFLSAFDSDANGIIDSTDLSRFGTNFGLSI